MQFAGKQTFFLMNFFLPYSIIETRLFFSLYGVLGYLLRTPYLHASAGVLLHSSITS